MSADVEGFLAALSEVTRKHGLVLEGSREGTVEIARHWQGPGRYVFDEHIGVTWREDRETKQG